MRTLAHIEKIVNIQPIPKADNIEVATVLGWNCVIAKKDQFKVNDLVIYIEIDSITPDKPEFEFLRQRKFRIRTIKLKSQISQGLILPISYLPNNIKVKEGLDVTEVLGITKYDPELQIENSQTNNKKDSKLVKLLKRNKFIREIFFSKIKTSWPEFFSKTDEERIQNIPWVLEKYKDEYFYVSEKLDGQSATFFVNDYPYFKYFKKKIFGVCSRNIWLKTPNNCNYWNIANEYDIEKKLRKLNRNIMIQGEIIGPTIQKNKYKLKNLDFYVFNVYDIDEKRYYGIDELKVFCTVLKLKYVPVLTYNFKLPDSIDKLVQYSKGNSTVLPTQKREGIVIRPLLKNIYVDRFGRLSFKVINPEFLLEEKD